MADIHYLFTALLLFLTGSSSTIQTTELHTKMLKHIALVKDMKAYHRAKAQRHIHASAQSQTQSYLSIDELKKRVHNNWDAKLNQHSALINTILNSEIEHAATHYVFYHGQGGFFRIVQDIVTKTYEHLNLDPAQAKFTFLRLWYESLQEMQVNAFLEDEEKQGAIDGRFDRRDDLRQKLLSVNLSLFGNATWVWAGECTFDYFINNFSINPPDIDQLLITFFDKLGIPAALRDRFIAEIQTESIYKEIASSGLLLQIFIPKDKVDDYVYLARPLGIPYANVIADTCYDQKKKRHIKISPILEQYIKNPQSMKASILDTLQARIILSQDLILNLESGVIIARYGLVDHDKIHCYEQKLEALVQELGDYFIKTHTSTPSSLVAGSPLARLGAFMSRH